MKLVPSSIFCKKTNGTPHHSNQNMACVLCPNKKLKFIKNKTLKKIIIRVWPIGGGSGWLGHPQIGCRGGRNQPHGQKKVVELCSSAIIANTTLIQLWQPLLPPASTTVLRLTVDIFPHSPAMLSVAVIYCCIPIVITTVYSGSSALADSTQAQDQNQILFCTAPNYSSFELTSSFATPPAQDHFLLHQ